ncbi:hypothetical protein NDI76_21715 [Halogeometricum sp. S1BR25-6]|uniref:Uncharacterized protein n=1 Tax=Halogeometricum salsisoli TaxID=2950536 RepID=A0ABU2GM21_9EURY|nr:hypothetical protein [Halogeometricum sp. S1BR25-6]MDS0301354.1 hypothetical protein [Halogeometricum sp. S1BR25-6]
MVVDTIILTAVQFALMLLAVYIGALRALRVYFDPDKESIFLPFDEHPPEY